MRERLPDRRINMQSEIAWQPQFGKDGSKIDVGVGFYSDGRPAEVFATARKSDMDAVLADACVVLSIALQHGTPADTLVGAIGRQALPAHVEKANPDALGPPLSPVGAIVAHLSALERRRLAAAKHAREVIAGATSGRWEAFEVMAAVDALRPKLVVTEEE